MFNECFTSYYEDPHSDNYFLLVNCIYPEERGLEPFRFFNVWNDHPGNFGLLNSVWNTTIDARPHDQAFN